MTNAVKAGAVYFAIVFATGFVLGTLRVLFLAPRLGETAAVLAELPAIQIVSWFACRRLVASFNIAAAPAPRLMMGGFAFLLLMAAELALSLFVLGRPAADHWQHYSTFAGSLGLAGQIAFATFPYALLKLAQRDGRRR